MGVESQLLQDDPVPGVMALEVVIPGRRADGRRPAAPLASAITTELAAMGDEIVERAMAAAHEELMASAPLDGAVDHDALSAAVTHRVQSLLVALDAGDVTSRRDGTVVVLPVAPRSPDLPAPVIAAVARAARVAVLAQAATVASLLPGAPAAADAMAMVAERLAAGEVEAGPPVSAAVAARQRRAALLRAIIDHNFESDDAALRAAAAAGHDVDVAHGMIALTAAGVASATPPARRVELGLRLFQRSCGDALHLPLRAADIPHAAFVVPATLRATWQHAVEVAEQVARMYQLCAVVAEPATGLAALRTRERTASILVALVHQEGAPCGVVHERERLLDVLLRSVDAAAGDAFVQSVLGPVLALSPARSEPLLDTLAELLAARGGFAAAAQRLRVHRETVKYRMGRLTELTGYSVADPTQRTHLDVALRLGRFTQKCDTPSRHAG